MPTIWGSIHVALYQSRMNHMLPAAMDEIALNASTSSRLMMGSLGSTFAASS